MSEHEERLADVLATIEKAARLSGRSANDVDLIAVSKTHAAEQIEPLLALGHRSFGENRVQEAQGKWPNLRTRYRDVRLHMIGQLQSNKAEDAVALFDVIHSVDRASLAKALGKAMGKSDKRPDCFVQVDIGDEPQKGGCPVNELPDFLALCSDKGLPIVGLMCIPPADTEAAPYFALLRKLRDRHDLPCLSMGMSGDYETAIMLGATDVRVGTALFGARGTPL
ncbi:MAG: YggS family pyridoxal phosphate-dependent enzyme [Pacificimonas sp.]